MGFVDTFGDLKSLILQKEHDKFKVGRFKVEASCTVHVRSNCSLITMVIIDVFRYFEMKKRTVHI